MGLSWLLALQAAATPAPPPPMARIDFDLAQARSADPADIEWPSIWSEACGPEDSEQIVVCGRRDGGRYRTGLLLPDPPAPMDELGAALSTTLGPVELGSFKKGDGTRGFGLRMKF